MLTNNGKADATSVVMFIRPVHNMHYNHWKWIIRATLLLLFVSGCRPYYAWRYAELTSVAHTFLRAAASRDTATLHAIASTEPIETASRVNAATLLAAAESLRPVAVHRVKYPPVWVVSYRFALSGNAKTLTIYFGHESGEWKIRKLLPPGDI